jgi:hypothetical protein
LSRTILIMAAGTGGHIFGSGPLAAVGCTPDVANGATSACTEDATSLRGEIA